LADKPEPLKDPKDEEEDILKMKIVRAMIKSSDGMDLERMLLVLGMRFENDEKKNIYQMKEWK
jgi:hypothetical protein